MSTERTNGMAVAAGPTFHNMPITDSHLAADMSGYSAVDKGRSGSGGIEQTLEYRGQNFNFQFAPAGLQSGSMVQDVGGTVADSGLFSQSGHYEGQLFSSQPDSKNEFAFSGQQSVAEFPSGQELEFIERNSLGIKRSHMKVASDTGQQQTSNVIIYLPGDVQICGQPTVPQDHQSGNFSRQVFGGDSDQVNDFVGNLSDIKGGSMTDTPKVCPEKILGVAAAGPPGERKLPLTLLEARGIKPETLVEEVPLISAEDLLRENSTPEAQESAKVDMKSLRDPPDIKPLTHRPQLNSVLKQRLEKDAASRHERTLASALSALFFESRSAFYQQELVGLLKPVVRLLEIVEGSAQLDVEAMRRMLGSLIGLVASLQEVIVADRRRSVMTHYGIEDSLQCTEHEGVELFGEEFLLRNGFIRRKDMAKSVKRISKKRSVSSVTLALPPREVCPPIAKRPRKGKLIRRKDDTESDDDPGDGDEIAQIIVLDDSADHHQQQRNITYPQSNATQQTSSAERDPVVSATHNDLAEHESDLTQQHLHTIQGHRPRDQTRPARQTPSGSSRLHPRESQTAKFPPTATNAATSSIKAPIFITGVITPVNVVRSRDDLNGGGIKSILSEQPTVKNQLPSEGIVASADCGSVPMVALPVTISNECNGPTGEGPIATEPLGSVETKLSGTMRVVTASVDAGGQHEAIRASGRNGGKRADAPPVRWKCSFCEQSFIKRLHLAQHLKQTHLEKLPQCKFCNRRFAFEATLRQHLEEKHPTTEGQEKRPECEHCGKTFSDKNRLQAHLFVHTGTKQFECNVCQRRCLTKAHLDQHMASHGRGEERFYCERCDKPFAKKTNYKHHLRLHSGEKNFECELCHKRFATRQYLHIHLRSHSAEKPFTCDICGRGFQFQHVLVDHVRTHTGETPFVCEVCGISFKVKRTLKRHMKTHGDERPHECHICQRGFKVKATLREHMKTHSNEKPYQCHECGLAYKRNVELRKHACLARQQQQQPSLALPSTSASSATGGRLLPTTTTTTTTIQLAPPDQHSSAMNTAASSAINISAASSATNISAASSATNISAASSAINISAASSALNISAASSALNNSAASSALNNSASSAINNSAASSATSVQSAGHSGRTNLIVDGGCDTVPLAEELAIRVGSVSDAQHSAAVQTVIPVGAVQQTVADGTATATIILQPMASVGAGPNFAGIHFINL